MADYTVGEAYVELKPSARGFSKDAKKALAAVDLDKSVDLEADATKLEAAVKAAKEQIASLNREKASPSIDFDVAVAEAKIAEVQAKLDELSRKEATPKVVTQTAEAQRDLASLTRQLEQLNARKASVDVDADISAATTNLRELEAKLDEVNRRRAEPKVTADTTTARQRLSELDSELRRVSSLRATPTVELAVAQARQQAIAIRAELDRLGAMRPSVKVDADIASASAKLALLNAELNRIDGRNVRVDADVSGLSTFVGVAGLVAGALGTIPAAAAAAGGALTALSGVAGAAGQGIGAALLGFSGISDALKAVESDEKSAATSSAASSKTRASGANQVASAQASLQQAQTQADRAAITGAQQVSSAQQSLQQARTAQARTAVQGAQQVADAERSLQQAVTQAARQRITSDQQVAQARRAVSDAITSSNQRVAAAEASLASAQRGRQYAQEALTRATEDATRANRDLQLSVAGAGLAEQRAALSLAQARDRLAKANTSDPLELADLSLSVREAEQNLKEVQNRYGDLRGEQAKWAQTGIQGSDQVVAATRALQDAQRGVASAQGDVTQAQVSGARAVADAQMSLAQTVQQASWQQADSAMSVADAQRGVQRAAESAAQANADAALATAQAQDGVAKAVQQASWQQADAAKGVQDAQRALAQAYESAGEAGVAGAKQAQYALSKLSPEGRAFVDFLTKEWKPAWDNTSKEISGRMLPGIQAGMKSLLSLQPQLTASLSDTGAIIGDVAARAGAMAASGPFAKSFASIMASNNRMLEGMGDAALSLFGAFTDLWEVAGPIAEQFVRLGTNAAQAFESWIIGEKASGDLQKSLQSGADTMMWLGGVLKDLVVDLYATAQGFAPLAGALIEIIRSSVDFIATVTSFSPALTSMVAGMALAWAAVSKLNGALKGMAFLTTVSQAGALGGSLKTLLIPSALAATDGMQRFGGAMTTAAGKVGLSESAASKFGGAVTKVGSALPLVGAAIIAVAVANDAFTTSTAEAAEAVARGGLAAQRAREDAAGLTAELNAQNAGMPGWMRSLDEWVNVNIAGAATTDSLNAELEEQRSKMTNLERAQSLATQAQGDYELAVRNFGATSPQAISALQNLNDRSRDVEIAQIAVREKTDLATAALIYQRDQILASLDADLRKRQATQDLARDQQAYADALAQHGPKSAQAEAAAIQLEQTQLRVAEAARSGKDGMLGYAQSIGDLVAKSNGQLTPTLAGMVQSLDLAGLSAAGAKVQIDNAGNAVAVFPNGKTVLLNADSSPVPGQLAFVKSLIDGTRGTVGVDADPTSGVATVGAFKLRTDTTTGVVTIDGNITPADQQRLGIQAKTDGTTGVMFIDGNPVPCDGKLNGMRVTVDRTTGVMTIDGNKDPADAQSRRAHDNAAAPVTFPLNTDTRPAERSWNGFFGWLGDRARSLGNWFVNLLNSNAPVPGRAAGGPVGMAHGGVVAGALRGYARGAGGSTRIAASDTVPAMLTPGEFVVRKRAVDRVGLPALEAINGMALGGLVGFAAGGAANPQPMSAGSGSSAAADVAVPVGDPSATGAAASATSSLASSMASAAGQAAVLQPALTALAATQAGVLAPATAAVTAGQQALVTGGILPLVGTMLGSLFPTLGVYQQQVGVAAPAANTALQTSQLATQAQTTATALNTAVNSGLMNAAVTGMSLTGQAQHAALRGTQLATQLSNAQTATSTAVNSQNMAISTTNMSLIGQQQHGNLRLSQGLTQASNNTTALNTATNNANMTATTSGMSTAVQTYLSAVRGGQGLLNQATLAMADWWRAQLGRTLPDAANPLRAVITGPFNRGIIAAWNTLDAQFALGKRVPDVVPGFATGGVYPGYTPGRDIGYAAVSGGEAIMRPEWTRAVGHGYVDAANAAARAGGVKGVSSFLSMAPSPSSGSDEGRAKLKLMDRFTGLDGPPGPVVGHFAPGGVQPHVARASDEVESRLGRMPGGVGGLGARANASDHPSGHALDFMTLRNMPLGDRVAGYLSANSQRLLVKYLIWKQQINQGSGWKPMEDRGNPTANHMDHVHASFLRWGQVGSPFAGGGMFDPAALVEEAFKDTYRQIGAMRGQFPSAHAGRGLDVAQRAADGAKAAAIKKMNEMMTFADPGGAGVERWRPMVLQALARVGQPAAHANITLRRMNQESGGNPRAINNWDSNAAKGIPSKGLMQVIDPTFQRYRDPALSPDIWDPLANTVASMRYALGRYGNLPAAYNRAGGYDNGGLLGTGMTLAYNGTGAPERVLDNVETRNYDTLTRLMGRGGVKVDSPAYSGAQQGAVIHVHPREMQSEQKIALGVKREFDWESRLA